MQYTNPAVGSLTSFWFALEFTMVDTIDLLSFGLFVRGWFRQEGTYMVFFVQFVLNISFLSPKLRSCSTYFFSVIKEQIFLLDSCRCTFIILHRIRHLRFTYRWVSALDALAFKRFSFWFAHLVIDSVDISSSSKWSYSIGACLSLGIHFDFYA